MLSDASNCVYAAVAEKLFRLALEIFFDYKSQSNLRQCLLASTNRHIKHQTEETPPARPAGDSREQHGQVKPKTHL